MAKYMTREEFFHILLWQRQSNLTVKDFCANEGYNRSQFYDWRSRFNISDEELKSGSVPTAGMDGFVPISIDNNNVSAPTFQSQPALCPQKTEKTSGKCTDNSEISLELPNGIKMKFKGTGGCKAALSLLTKLCGTCFAWTTPRVTFYAPAVPTCVRACSAWAVWSGKNERGCPEWRCVHFYQQAEKPYKASARRNGRSGDVRETAWGRNF